jgi:chemotaxis protein histidine kinase CheA
MVLGDGFPKPAAVGSLNLSIVPPWFGQTRMEGGALPIALSSGVETVRVKEALQTRNPEPRFDSVETEEALAYIRNAGLSRGAPMQSTLHPKLTDDPHDVIVVPPDMVRVAPDPVRVAPDPARVASDSARVAPDVARAAPADEEISSLLRDAARRHSDAQVPKASDMPAAAAIPPVDTTFRPAAAGVLGPGRTQSIGWRAMRGFTAVLLAACIAGAGIAWELYGDAAKQLIAPWVPKFALASSLSADQPVLSAQAAAPAVEAAAATAANAAPAQPAPPAQSAAEAAAPAAAAPAETAQLQSMARDVASLGQEVVQLKASIEQLKASQQQISREIAKASENKASENKASEAKASEPVARPRISAPPPRPAAARVRRPMPSYPPPQVAAAPPMPQTAARYPATAPYYGRQPDYMPRQVEPQPQIAADPQADPEVATAPRPPMPVR